MRAWYGKHPYIYTHLPTGLFYDSGRVVTACNDPSSYHTLAYASLSIFWGVVFSVLKNIEESETYVVIAIRIDKHLTTMFNHGIVSRMPEEVKALPL